MRPAHVFSLPLFSSAHVFSLLLFSFPLGQDMLTIMAAANNRFFYHFISATYGQSIDLRPISISWQLFINMILLLLWRISM